MSDDINVSLGTDEINVEITGGETPLVQVAADTLVNLDGGDTDTGIRYNSTKDRVEVLHKGTVVGWWKR